MRWRTERKAVLSLVYFDVCRFDLFADVLKRDPISVVHWLTCRDYSKTTTRAKAKRTVHGQEKEKKKKQTPKERNHIHLLYETKEETNTLLAAILYINPDE